MRACSAFMEAHMLLSDTVTSFSPTHIRCSVNLCILRFKLVSFQKTIVKIAVHWDQVEIHKILCLLLFCILEFVNCILPKYFLTSKLSLIFTKSWLSLLLTTTNSYFPQWFSQCHVHTWSILRTHFTVTTLVSQKSKRNSATKEWRNITFTHHGAHIPQTAEPNKIGSR